MSARICVATPLYGDPASQQVAVQYAGTLFALGRQLDVLCGEATWDRGPVKVDPAYCASDVVYARSELVHRFLQSPEYTHLLFWDSDVVGTPDQIARLLTGMLRVNRPIVGVPYPMKRIDWTEACWFNDRSGAHAEADAVHFAPELDEIDGEPDASGCVAVDRLPIGFALIQRAALVEMVDYYRPELSFYPALAPKDGPPEMSPRGIVALFMLMFRDGELLREDYAFCRRWLDMGETYDPDNGVLWEPRKLWLYVGDGAPLSHLGAHVFCGSPLALERRWPGLRKP